MPKDRVNLLLDRDAVERGKRYADANDTSLSQLVSAFLSALPTGDSVDERALPPATRRLFRAAAGGPDREDYRRHLLEKYGK